jgi:transposase
MDLRTVMRHYSNLVIRLVILKNSFKAVLRNEGISTQSKWVTSRNKEKCLEIKNPMKRKVAEALFEEMNTLEMTKQKLESEFKQNYFSVPIVKNLMTIPGIGPVRAHVIAAFICSPYRFENKHKLWAYAKLVNHADESDGKLISKRSPHGRSELKEAFVGAAVRVMAYSGESALKNY